MKSYFLTDESEKSLAPFFSRRVLETALTCVAMAGVFLVVFWSRRPLSELMATGNAPAIFFLMCGATLVVNSYLNLCCGTGDLVRRGYHIIRLQTDTPTYEMEIEFYRYGLPEFLLHTLVLLLAFLPLLSLAAFSTAVSPVILGMALSVLYTTALFCRLCGFLTYLWRGRMSTLGYFASRALMIVFIFVTIILAPAINPLRLLYRLNNSPSASGDPFAIYTAVILIAILVLILVNNALVKRHMDKSNRLETFREHLT